MKKFSALVLVLIFGAVGCSTASSARSTEIAEIANDNKDNNEKGKTMKSFYDFEVKDIEGKNFKLGDYRGKVVLVVNVASQCGYTPQYEGLQALYSKYKDQGFVILGFPANNFGAQEPGTNEEIKTFCTKRYKVTFPMFAKISVKGADKAPLYQT